MKCQLLVSLFAEGNITAFRQDTLAGGVTPDVETMAFR